MDDGQRGLDAAVGQVGVIGEQLRGQEHPLVADRPARHRRDVKAVSRAAQHLGHAAFGALAGQEEPSLQFFVFQAVAGNEDLADHRLRVAGDLAQRAVVGRHVAPAQHAEFFPPDGRRQQLLALPAHCRAPREEQHRHAISPGSRDCEAQPVGLGGEELVGHLQENAGPVAGRFVGPRGPAVHEVQQHLLAMLDHRMIAGARDIDNRTNTAGIVLPLGIVETSGFGRDRHHRESSSIDLGEGGQHRGATAQGACSR